MVPCVEYGQLSPLERLEIEVEENVARLDFDFKERAAALAALHELRVAQNPAQTLTQTSVEARGYEAPTEVSNAIIITQHLADPDVAKAKNAKEALTIIRKKAEAIHQAKLSKSVDMAKVKHQVIRGEALEVLPKLPEKSVDVILADPQYGIGADNFGTQSATGHDYEDSYTAWKELFRAIPDQLARVAKDRAHCYLFCDPRRFDELSTYMVLANWTVFPTALIWSKGNGMLPLPFHGPRRTYESILYAYRGDRKTLVVKNDLINNIPPVTNLRHGAQKPVALYCDLLARSASPGDVCLDWCGGSGPILVAANIRKLTAIYIERDEGAYNVALTRANTMEIDDGAKADDGIRINLDG
jgi:DNA modification methylase